MALSQGAAKKSLMELGMLVDKHLRVLPLWRGIEPDTQAVLTLCGTN